MMKYATNCYQKMMK